MLLFRSNSLAVLLLLPPRKQACLYDITERLRLHA